MKYVTMDNLPVAASTRRALQKEARVHGAIIDEGQAVVWGPGLHYGTEFEAKTDHPDALIGWRRTPEDQPKTRIARALAMMESERITAYAAAKAIGVEVSAVYRAQRLRKEKGVCPCCGQVLP